MLRQHCAWAACVLLASACGPSGHPISTPEAAIALAAPHFTHWSPTHEALQAKHMGRWWLVTSGDPETRGAGTLVDSKTGSLGFYSRKIITKIEVDKE